MINTECLVKAVPSYCTPTLHISIHIYRVINLIIKIRIEMIPSLADEVIQEYLLLFLLFLSMIGMITFDQFF